LDFNTEKGIFENYSNIVLVAPPYDYMPKDMGATSTFKALTQPHVIPERQLENYITVPVWDLRDQEYEKAKRQRAIHLRRKI
jgi:hypothetical protein